MAKSAVFGLASGLAVVVLTMIVVALVNLPQATDAAAGGRRADAATCRADALADAGYGLTRPDKRERCAALRD